MTGCVLCLQPGTYCYQYLVDGTWMTSPDAPVGPDDEGHLCNKVLLNCRDQGCLHADVSHRNASASDHGACHSQPSTAPEEMPRSRVANWRSRMRVEAVLQMTVEVPPAFHIFYATGWEEPMLRLRELCADGTPRHEVSHRPPLGHFA